MRKYVLKKGVKIEKKSVDLWFGSNGSGYLSKELAEYAHAEKSICECGNTTDVYRIRCDVCQAKVDEKDYEKLEQTDWDYKTPITLFRGDDYFFDTDDLISFCEEKDIKPEDLQLVLCEPYKAPMFSIDDHLYDALPEDWTANDLGNKDHMNPYELEKIVNDWLKAVGTISWHPSNIRVLVTSEEIDYEK